MPNFLKNSRLSLDDGSIHDNETKKGSNEDFSDRQKSTNLNSQTFGRKQSKDTRVQNTIIIERLESGAT